MALGFRMGAVGGQSKPKVEYIAPFNTLTRTYPSDTTLSNATKRRFTKNSYVVGLTGDNYYYPSNVTSFSIPSGNRVTITASSASYGLGLVLNDNIQVGKTYKVELQNITSSVILYAMFYKSDGTFISFTGGGQFTVPSETVYTVLLIRASSNNVTATVQIDSISEI